MPQEVPRAVQRVRDGGLLPPREGLLRLRRGGCEEHGQPIGPEELPEDAGGRHPGDRRGRLPQGVPRPVDPPHIRDQPGPAPARVRVYRQETLLQGAPLGQAASAEAVRPVRPEGGGEAEGGRPQGHKGGRGPDLQGLPQGEEGRSEGQRRPIRLGHREGGRQEGPAHHHLPQIRVPVRDPHRQGQPIQRPPGHSRRVREDRQGAGREDIPHQPGRQRVRVLVLPEDRALRRRGEGLLRLLHQPIQGHGQGRVREAPRARQVLPAEGPQPRLPHPGAGRRDVLQHQLVRPEGEGGPGPLRHRQEEVRRGLPEGNRDPAGPKEKG